MIANQHSAWKRREPRGISLVIVAFGMFFILGMAGLAIDLASLYVARSQAQRAADAAALAGAHAWVDNSCVDGTSSSMPAGCTDIAIRQAKAVGDQNLIGGVNPNIQTSDISFNLSNPNDPQITVVARRTMPTFFVKIFGVDTANVSAQATAEAFNPSGSDVPIGVRCVKPWFFSNCDPGNTTTGPLDSTNCNPAARPFVLGSGNNLTVARDEPYPTGVIGEPITMKPGNPGGAAAPGQYLAAFIPNNTQMPTICPECTKSTGGSGSGTGSAAVYRANIECCNQNAVVCGVTDAYVASSAGNMVGPTNQGVDCLIHQNPGCGQDYLQGVTTSPCTPTSDPPQSVDLPDNPFVIIPGPNDNYGKGQTSIPMSVSNSVVAVPIYKGILQSGQNQVTVIGFLKMFIKYADSSQQGTIYGYILDVTTCGGGNGTGTGGTGENVISTMGSTTPVRLIRTGS